MHCGIDALGGLDVNHSTDEDSNAQPLPTCPGAAAGGTVPGTEQTLRGHLFKLSLRGEKRGHGTSRVTALA